MEKRKYRVKNAVVRVQEAVIRKQITDNRKPITDIRKAYDKIKIKKTKCLGTSTPKKGPLTRREAKLEDQNPIKLMFH
ncbi:hypothetical protein ACMDB5_01585 [Flavobacterium sp. W1B]|uniref:hypothetical protein n=1 Tax=Flavobacterium sp. W1B TaxID=3394146 RepID=UPI0039BC459C